MIHFKKLVKRVKGEYSDFDSEALRGALGDIEAVSWLLNEVLVYKFEHI